MGGPLLRRDRRGAGDPRRHRSLAAEPGADPVARRVTRPSRSKDRHMTDERDPLDSLRDLRPDRLQDAEPNDPWKLAEERDRLMSVIEGTNTESNTSWHSPAIYPRLGYEDEHAAVEFLTRSFGFRERREARMENDDGHILA